MKYRRKTIEYVEAFQLGVDKAPSWFVNEYLSEEKNEIKVIGYENMNELEKQGVLDRLCSNGEFNQEIIIYKLGEKDVGRRTDYICKNSLGRLYAEKKEEFEQAYEKVEE